MSTDPIRLLLVEDNPGDARLLRELLDPLQFHVTYAERLSQATQYLDAAPSDVVVLDLTLPDSAGLETVQRVQSCAPNTPIVVLTGRDDEALALQAVRQGAQDYLVKGQIESNLLTRSIQYAIERKRVGLALQANEARYRLLAENATDMIWTVDLNMQITFVSPSVTRLLGFTVEEAIARTMQQAYTPATFEKATQMFAEEMARERAGRGDPKRSRALELELYRKDGSTVPVEAHFGFLRDATGQPTGILATVRDITERKHVEDALRALSLTDDLTSLYNRRGFLMLAEQQFRIAKRTQRAMLVLFADIDDLKKINDTWGHAEGDRALIQAAALLKNTFREADIVARLGGDEFVAMPLEIKTGATEAVTARLQTNLAILNAEENRRYALSLSIGIATFDPAHPCSTEELLAIADAAMYEQKQHKRNGASNDAR